MLNANGMGSLIVSLFDPAAIALNRGMHVTALRGPLILSTDPELGYVTQTPDSTRGPCRPSDCPHVVIQAFEDERWYLHT